MLNKVQLIGRLGKDPEVRNTNTGNSVANFSIACSEKWKDQNGEWKEKTEWINIVVWDNKFSKLASNVIAKYVHKGDKIYLEGKLQTRSWEKEGVTRYTTEVIVNNVILLENKNQSNGGGGEYQGDRVQQEYNNRGNEPEYKPSGDSSASDDLPF